MNKYSLTLVGLLFVASASLAFAQKPDALKVKRELIRGKSHSGATPDHCQEQSA